MVRIDEHYFNLISSQFGDSTRFIPLISDLANLSDTIERYIEGNRRLITSTN
jgi:hypothetical protein